MSTTFLTGVITALFILDFIALYLARVFHRVVWAEDELLNEALAGWEYSQARYEEDFTLYMQDMFRCVEYEAALRRELATLRARKRNCQRPVIHDELERFNSLVVRINTAHWRKDRTEGNWGKYLQREKEVRAHEAKTAE